MGRVYGDLERVEGTAIRAWPGDVDRPGPHVFHIQLGHRAWIFSTNKTCTHGWDGFFKHFLYMPLKVNNNHIINKVIYFAFKLMITVTFFRVFVYSLISINIIINCYLIKLMNIIFIKITSNRFYLSNMILL